MITYSSKYTSHINEYGSHGDNYVLRKSKKKTGLQHFTAAFFKPIECALRGVSSYYYHLLLVCSATLNLEPSSVVCALSLHYCICFVNCYSLFFS